MGGTPNRYFRIPDPVGPVAATAARCGVSHADTAIYGAMLWMSAVVRQGFCPLWAEVRAFRIFRADAGDQRTRLALALHALGDELCFRQLLGPPDPPN